MMSARPCGNCKKTVYVNEKMDAEGNWYHRPCFKCMAPDCHTSLTLRNFQVAALEGAKVDEYTGKPIKVLVCKEHVPMLKHSLTADSLSIKHTTSAPKPSISGLHRSVMGDRTEDGSLASMSSPSGEKLNSPRSLDQGSHASFLKTSLKPSAGQDHDSPDKMKEEEQQESASTTGGGGGNTLPKFRSGRFVVEASDSIALAHKEQEDAQDIHKDDNSFRNIPVHHHDYEQHSDAAETKNDEHHVISSGQAPRHEDDRAGEWDDGLEDNKQERVFTMKGGVGAGANKPHEEENGPKKVDLTFSSKLMEQHHPRTGGVHETDDQKESVVDDDEWDAAPTDDYSRRERALGM